MEELMVEAAWKVFYSYSHQDAHLRAELAKFLAPLRHTKKIVEWHDREILPGADWEKEISSELESANLILLLVSADFLASEYCFGVEIETAMARKKRGEAEVVPILLRECPWRRSRFSELQIVPPCAKPIMSWGSTDEAFTSVEEEISRLVSARPPVPRSAAPGANQRVNSSLEFMRQQIQTYARIYERIRQRMPASADRTWRMEEIFKRMRNVAVASYPLLDELATSPSPGERLAAVAILQVFSSENYFAFLLNLIRTEKPFVGYHAVRALRFAIGSIDPTAYPKLVEAIREAEFALQSASVGFDADRQTELRNAKEELQKNIDALSVPARDE
jgi:hypothetical protein